MTDIHATFIDVFSSGAGNYGAGAEFFWPLAAKLVERSGVRAGDNVLDVGCGRGAVLFQAAEVAGDSGSAIGIDLADGMVEHSAAEAEERGLNTVSVRKMDGYSPDFAVDSFDKILGSMSIIFIPDLVGAFGHYHALLREGGVLAFTAPAAGANAAEWKIGPFDMRAMAEQAFGSAENAEFTNLVSQFDSLDPHSLLGDLRTAGFTEPIANEVTTPVTAANGKAMVDWTFTHGMRTFWDAIPEQKRAELVADTAARIDAEREDADHITYDVAVNIFFATK